MSEHRGCPVVEGAEAIRERCADVLRDESNLVGSGVERVYFPETVEQAAAVIEGAAASGTPLTVSGARTGITGGAVPVECALVLSLTRLSRLLEIRKDERSGEVVARAEAGLTLAALGEEIASCGEIGGRKWFYPVDPTEATAELGGTIATDASGARSFRYGPTRDWVRALKIILADGKVVELRRGEITGEVKGAGGVLRFPEGFGGRELALPQLARPECKCVAGYRLDPGVDLVDILIGSEGTLAVIAEVEVALAPEPEGILALMCFLGATSDGTSATEVTEDTENDIRFASSVNSVLSVADSSAVRRAEGLVKRFRADGRLDTLSIEYFDPTALDFLRTLTGGSARGGGKSDAMPASSATHMPAAARSAVFIEVACESEDALDAVVEAIDEDLSLAGGSIDDTWAGDDEAGRSRMRTLRHGLPEAVNSAVAALKRDVPELHKVGTDLAVPDSGADEMNRIYRERLPASGMQYVVFGHAGENHLHVNFIPETRDDLARAKELHMELAREAVRLGGAVTAEHGIGRLKRELLEIQYGADGVEALRRVKDFFDPKGILNPGVMFRRMKDEG